MRTDPPIQTAGPSLRKTGRAGRDRAVLWVAITLGFGFYGANITNYNATYGSLAAIVIFLMWLFLSAFAVLIGTEVNAEMERQTTVDSTVGPDRPIGSRGAVMADNIVVDEASPALLEKKKRRYLARPTGFEPVAPRLGILCSILLSYGRVGIV